MINDHGNVAKQSQHPTLPGILMVAQVIHSASLHAIQEVHMNDDMKVTCEN